MERQLGQQVGRAFFSQFKDLRDIQKLAIPPILAGNDVLVRSSTASGKTEAALAPLVERYLQNMRVSTGVSLIVVSPTRALANDLARRLEGPLDQLGLRVGVRHGERNQLDVVDKPNVLITTPESFDGIVSRRAPAITDAQAVVLDEAHLLFNTQRGLQVGLTLRRLELWLKRELQTVGLSATIGAAREVWGFFRPDREVTDIHAPGGRPLEYQIKVGVTVNELVSIVQKFDNDKLLVFVNSRKECETITDRLRRSGGVRNVFAHHSSLATQQREHVESAFNEASSGVCVATPTLELGIDIGSIDLVILYGAPSNWQSLAQRVGRGNRRHDYIEALFCVPERARAEPNLADRLTFQALLGEAFQDQGSPVRTQHLIGALGQQFCSELDARGTFVGINRLVEIAEPWPHLDRELCTSVLDSLVAAGVLQRHPAYNRYGPGNGLHELRERWQLWSNFAGSGQSVDVTGRGRHIGQVSSTNLAGLAPGDVFLLGGQRWMVERAGWRGIDVAQTTRNPTCEIGQSGTKPSPSQTVADWMRRLISGGNFVENVKPAAETDRLMSELEPLRSVLRAGNTPLLQSAALYHYLTFAGPLINKALAVRFGDTGRTDGVVLTSDHAIDFSQIPTSIEELVGGMILTMSTERSQFQNWLPDELLEREERSIMMSDPTLIDILGRLRRSPVELVRHDPLLRALAL